MLHYTDGIEVVIGDVVRGQRDRDSKEIIGTVVQVIPDSKLHNIVVVVIRLREAMPNCDYEIYMPKFTLFQVNQDKYVAIVPSFEYGQANHFIKIAYIIRRKDWEKDCFHQ